VLVMAAVTGDTKKGDPAGTVSWPSPNCGVREVFVPQLFVRLAEGAQRRPCAPALVAPMYQFTMSRSAADAAAAAAPGSAGLHGGACLHFLGRQWFMCANRRCHRPTVTRTGRCAVSGSVRSGVAD